MKHTTVRRSECPINYTLEIVGDQWSLLIIRDIVYFGKCTFGAFFGSAEGIAMAVPYPEFGLGFCGCRRTGV